MCEDVIKLLLHIKPDTPHVGGQIKTMNAPFIINYIKEPFENLVSFSFWNYFDLVDDMIILFNKTEILIPVMTKCIRSKWRYAIDNFRFIEATIDKTHRACIIIISNCTNGNDSIPVLIRSCIA